MDSNIYTYIDNNVYIHGFKRETLKWSYITLTLLFIVIIIILGYAFLISKNNQTHIIFSICVSIASLLALSSLIRCCCIFCEWSTATEENN